MLLCNFLNLLLLFKLIKLVQVNGWSGLKGHLDSMSRHVNVIIDLLIEYQSFEFVHFMKINMLLN